MGCAPTRAGSGPQRSPPRRTSESSSLSSSSELAGLGAALVADLAGAGAGAGAGAAAFLALLATTTGAGASLSLSLSLSSEELAGLTTFIFLASDGGRGGGEGVG